MKRFPLIQAFRSAMILGLTALPLSLVHADTMKISTVDMQRALQSVETGKTAKAQLEKEFTAKKKELQSEEASIKKMADELKNQSLVMNEEARTKKQAELQERYLKLQEKTGRSQMELQQKERDLTQPIIDKLKASVAEMGKAKSTVVLEKSAVLYAPEKDDLTDDLISAFNKQAKGSKVSKDSKESKDSE